MAGRVYGCIEFCRQRLGCFPCRLRPKRAGCSRCVARSERPECARRTVTAHTPRVTQAHTFITLTNTALGDDEKVANPKRCASFRTRFLAHVLPPAQPGSCVATACADDAPVLSGCCGREPRPRARKGVCTRSCTGPLRTGHVPMMMMNGL